MKKTTHKIAIVLYQTVLVDFSKFYVPLEMGVTALIAISPMSLMIFVQLGVQSFLK